MAAADAPCEAPCDYRWYRPIDETTNLTGRIEERKVRLGKTKEKKNKKKRQQERGNEITVGVDLGHKPKNRQTGKQLIPLLDKITDCRALVALCMCVCVTLSLAGEQTN